MLDPAKNIYNINSVGPEQEICPALPWMYFSYVYVGCCFHSCICYLSVQTPSNYIEFLRYQVSENCKHTVLFHLLVEAQSSVWMKMRRNLFRRAPGYSHPQWWCAVTSQCLHPTVCPRIVCFWDIHVPSRRVQQGGKAGDNSGEEVRSEFVPVCSEGAVLWTFPSSLMVKDA